MSLGTKAFHFNGVSPEGLWATPYCSITPVAQPPLEGSVAVSVEGKTNVVTAAIITKAIRNPQVQRQSQSKLPLYAGERFANFVMGDVFVFIIFGAGF